VYVGREDLELVEQINARGIDVVVRPLPTESPRRLRRGDDGRPVLTDDLQPLERPRAEVSARAAGQASPRGLAAETEEAAPEPSAGGGVRAGTVRVVNERGLHLRAAHLLAQRAARFASSVEVGWPDRLVNAKSLLGITTLGAAQGSELEVRVQGSDADAAWDAIRSLFESGFQEGGG
jgi:phosphocarrier protein